MCLRGIAFWLAIALVASRTVAETDFPYQATVTVDGASIHSGPGEAYYRTATIAAGTDVEIYRHAAGGWCAIRPPAGSFSWVSARFVRKTNEPGVGEVTESGVPARIGSKFGRERHVVQVRLDSGEPVEILGEQNNGGQTWCRIAPPAGEFRWIEERNLSTSTPRKEARLEPPPIHTAAPIPSEDPATDSVPPAAREGMAPNWKPPPPAAREGMAPNREPPPPAAREGMAPNWEPPPTAAGEGMAPSREPPPTAEEQPTTKRSTDGFRTRLPNTKEFSAPPLQSDDDAPPKQSADAPQPRRWRQAGSPAWRQPAGGASNGFAGAPAGAPTPNTKPPFTRRDTPPSIRPTQRSVGPESSSDVFIEELNAVGFSLSHMVSQEPGTWRFDSLRRRATALLAAAPTAADRANVRQLLAKIARFEELQHRRAALNGRARAAIAQRAVDRTPIPNGRREPPEWGSAPTPVRQADEPRVRNERIERNAAAPAARSRSANRPGDTIRIPDDVKPLPRDDKRFDAVGVLKRVGSRRRDAPRFALVDETGDVVSFITPSPGVNLQPYIGDRVGVYGTCGFMPEYDRAHVTAARVAPLLR